MSYMTELDAWLDKLMLPLPRFDDIEDDEDFPHEWYSHIKKEIKAKVLESFHNGLDAKEDRYELTDKGRRVAETFSREKAVKKEREGEAKPHRFWPRREK